MSEISYMPQEEIAAQIKLGNKEVMNKVLANKLIAGEPVKKEGVDDVKEVVGGSDTIHNGATAKETTGQQEVTSGVETGKDDKPQVSQEVQEYVVKLQENEEIIENIKKRRLDEKEQFLNEQKIAQQKLGEYESTVSDLQKRLSDMENSTKEQKVEVKKVEPIVLNESDEDLETAPVYSINNRKLIDSLKSDLNTALGRSTDIASDPAIKSILGKLNKMEADEKRRAENAEAEKTQALQKEVRQQLFNDIRTFQSRNDSFKTGKDPEELASSYKEFRAEVSDFIRSTKPRDVNAAIDSLIHGSSDKDEQLRDRAKKEGVKIPEDINTFMVISEINDLKNGYQYNNITGEFDQITDSMGRQVRHKSLDEAYKLSNYYNKINEARRTAAKDYQKKVDARGESAQILDNTQTADDSDKTKLSNAQIQELLSKPETLYRNNPELAKQVRAAYEQLGMTMPVRGGQQF